MNIRNPKDDLRMKVLITGAFGNIGMYAIRELLQHGYSITAFDVKNPANIKKAESLGNQIDYFWGDMRDPTSIESASRGCDVVVHLAAIIPPLSEKNPELTYQVNVHGTQTLLNIMKDMTPRPRLIFTSSVCLFGDTSALPPPRTVTDPIHPTDTYSATKAECEEIIHQSGIDAIILRLTATPAVNMNNMSPIIFEIPLDTRMEYVHPLDVARAIANSISCNNGWGRTLLIGGGKECQMLYRDFMGGIMKTLGIGTLPDIAFGKTPFYTDWLDTDLSQQLLQFQQFTYKDLLRELLEMFGSKLIFLKLLRPFIRLWLLRKSPYWRGAIRKKFTIKSRNGVTATS